MAAFPIILFLFLGTLVVGVLIWGYLAAKKRREAFQALARQLGLRYVERDDFILTRYGFLNRLRQGENRYAFNVLQGQYEGHPVKIFDYHYETRSTGAKGQRRTHHHYFSFFILEHDREFPELLIYPEGILSKLGQLLGFEDIDFESVEFSRAFVVKCKDKKFAYDVCHARMMEYLLAHRDLSIEIDGKCVALSFSYCLDPVEIPVRLKQLVEIRDLFPAYLYRS